MNRSKPRKTDRYEVEDRGFITPCWAWQLKINVRTGYGSVRVEGRDWLAHRWYYTETKGPIPKGLQLDHLCGQRDCVNPDHLEPVTPLENTRRNQGTKLSLEAAQLIETLVHEGDLSQKAIADRFGVSRGTVYFIKKHGAANARNPMQMRRATAR